MRINKFHIKNYRSLFDFKIDAFASTTIFYGENNAGKSNILSALHTIFKVKKQFDRGDFTPPTNFYEGIIENFSDNFYNNVDTNNIEFLVELIINTSELKISPAIKKHFPKGSQENKFEIKGIITKSTIGEQSAEMKTESIKLNGKIIYSYDILNNKYTYFPDLLDKDQKNLSELGAAFSLLISPMNDCVYVIGSGRDMHPTGFNNSAPKEVNPRSIKNFLHSLYLSEEGYKLFERINSIFNAKPFGFGEISFSIINTNLEIMIKENSTAIRLPIKHLGSGILQILYIITDIVYNHGRIVCIEELEQNLSPKLQNLALRKLQSMLGNNLNQIIISSHSSVFAKPKLSDAIYLIKKDGSKTVIAEIIKDSYKDAAKAHFIHSAPPAKTYSDKELKTYLDTETKKMAEDRFKM